MRNVVQEIESEITSLSGVISVHVVLSPDGLEIDEVHVVATHDRTPKQIVRDIETLILNNHDIRIDHKKISIAQLHDVDADAVATRQVEEAPSFNSVEKKTRERVRFISAKSNTYGLRWEVSVELERGRIPASATVNGAGSRQNKARLVAQATTEALNNYLGDNQAVAVEEVHKVEGSRHVTVVVLLSILTDRTEKILVGSSVLEDDLPRAVVQATLDAVNRAV
jgi:hypothetical protein